MIWRCLDSLMILAAFATVYIIPPLLAMRRLYPSADRTTLVVAAAGLGLSVQALLGFLWNHLVGHSPAIEACIYYFFWLSASVAICWRKVPIPRIKNLQSKIFNRFPLLALILMASLLLRSFDALDHASLGQSDAYTHLQFLRDVIQQGHLRNIVYPPGYSWVLALPVMTFNLDAYLITRYVGPFFGALMVAALYLLGCRHSRTTGLFAAALAAVCPLFYPLVKTGIGAFANQLGLVLLPLAILASLMERRFLFAVLLLGLTVTVPLFIFPLGLILFGHQLLRKVTSSSSTQQLSNLITYLIIFLLALSVAGYHFLSLGERHVTTTATLMTGIQTPSSKKPDATAPQPGVIQTLTRHPAGKLAVDLLTPKRVGLGSPLMNAILLTLAGMFGAFLVLGRRSGILSLIGLWGLLTTLQVGTGLLEFSLYQRSGWLLLEVTALAGGFILAWIWDWERGRKVLRPAILLGILTCLVIATLVPPRHRTITSSAENELATVLREVSAQRITVLKARGPFSFERYAPVPLLQRAAAAPGLAIITRRYTLFYGDQGNLTKVLPDPAAGIRQLPVEKDTRLVPPSNHFLCLVDRFSGLPDMGLLDRISPDLTRSLAQYQPLLYKPNDVILSFLDTLPPEFWRVTQEDRGKNLTVYFVERLGP